MTDQQQPVSPTALPTPDSLGLGHTPGQRGAEILAGFRAEKYPSPDTLALSRWSGRIIARLLMRMISNDAPMNFIVARLHGLEALIRKAVPPDAANLTLVELACGLSPRGVQLARAFPQARVIEVDLPGVVADKEQRLRRAPDVNLPPNIEWRAADLGVTPLSEVLKGEMVDVVSAEGLNAYFKPEEVTRIARHIKDSLKPGGSYISDVPWQEGMDTARQVASFFSRQAGVYKCVVPDEETARQLLLDAGYESVTLHRATQMVDELKLPQPMIDFSFFVAAQKAAAEPA